MKAYFQTLSLIALSVFFCIQSFGQSKFEGKISYTITYDQIPEAIKMYESMLPKTSAIYVKGENTRLEQSMALGSEQVVISNGKQNKVTVLINMLGQKYYMESSGDDGTAKSNIEILDETKEIAGYKCKLAEITTENQDDPILVYFTGDINATSNQFQDLNGFPLEYEIVNDGMRMTMTAIKVSEEKVDKNLFVIPEGYQLMTEDMIKSMGQ